MPSTFAGFAPSNIAAFFGVSPEQAQAIIALANNQQLSPAAQASLQTIGGRFAQGGDIMGGLQHLAEHPMGSKYHGDFNPTDTIANIATGGLYGLGQAGFDAVTGKQDLLSAARGGLNQLGPWGASTYNIPGYGHQIAETGNLIGAGAGIAGGGAGTFSTSGFGAAGAEAPYYAGSAAMSSVPGATVGFDAAGNPLYQVATATGKGAMTAEQAAAAGVPSMGGGSIAAAGGGFSPSVGGAAGYQLAQMLGGASPLSMPAMGAPMAGAQGGGTAVAAMNPALGGASQNDPHLGLAPRFEARQRGSREAPGLSTMPLVSEYYQQR